MIFIEKMKNMKIYKTQTFLPTVNGNKKKNSVITLLTPNYASSKKLMNHPLFVNKLRYASYYLERDISYYINDDTLEEATYNEEYSVYQLLTEISSEKRNSLKDSDFGIPSKRKFPLDTEKRVRSAIKFFNYVDKEDEEELASNIKKAMKKFDITDVQVGEKNRFKNYYNESVALTESLLKNEKDILYNKDKFESGEINLCFVTGHSGSGKSTLAHKKEKEKDVDAIELDDLLCIKDHFTMKQLKEYSDLIYSYFNGPGKKFYVGESDLRVTPEDQYEDILFRDFVHYAMKYSKSHKDKKYIIEGIWIFEIDSKNKPYFEPNEFDDYAFYIKGTSMIISKYRAAKRDSWDSDTPKRTSLKNFVTKNWKWYRFNEKQLNKFRDYFKKNPETILESKDEPLDNEESLEKSDVLFLSNITPENIVKAYKHLGVSLPDKVACKVHSGEDGNQNYLRPELWSDLINYVNGTVVECNTAYEGARNTTEKHKELIKKHGWDQFDVDIMDEDFDFELPIEKYNVIDKNYVGSHMRNYSSMVVLSHFKGHPMDGFGGALKQLSIGCASSRGKKYIHGFGNADRGDQILADFKGEPTDTNEQLNFINAMADAASSVHNFFKDNIVYINIMSNMSVDCDCVAHAEDPCMKDIGILISKDPVAIDKACVDLVYNSNDPGKNHLIERIESRGALNIFNACKNIDFGNTEYNLINLDAEESNDVSNEYANPDNIFSLIESNNSKNVIFDLGGVLLEDQDWRELIKKTYPDLKDQEIGIFVRSYMDFLDKSDTASYNDARVAFMSTFDDPSMRAKAIRAFNVLVDTVKQYDYTVKLLQDLQRKGYKLYYLSNWSNYGFNAMKAHGKLDFLKYFNDGMVSYEVGFMKPDVEIFNLFLKKMNLKPEECIFFDDKVDNCRGAKASGMNAYIWHVSNN